MKQRADAEENQNALMAAASEVFAEHGVDAPLDLIRMRAGVGRATMYRHFPDRRVLHLALVARSLERFETCRPKPGNRTVDLVDLLELAAQEAARSPALHAVWDKVRLDPDAAELVDRLTAVFSGPLQRAKKAGGATAWLCVEDMFLAVRMLGAASRGVSQPARQAEAARALSILIEGLGIRPPAPLEFQDDTV
tara:strand:+ start:80300 stop:80881 length:582 start_codon:yes stop_codon:yes gene_type:complete